MLHYSKPEASAASETATLQAGGTCTQKQQQDQRPQEQQGINQCSKVEEHQQQQQQQIQGECKSVADEQQQQQQQQQQTQNEHHFRANEQQQQQQSHKDSNCAGHQSLQLEEGPGRIEDVPLQNAQQGIERMVSFV
jgi:hypothetical protein